MRLTLVAVVLVAVVGMAAALGYLTFANERDFVRLTAAGDRAVAEDRHFQAIEAYSGAIALKPDSMVAHLKRGAVYQSRGELESALRDLRDAVEIDPSAPQALERLGDVNVALGRQDRAVERYEACLALDEKNPRVQYKLGLARYRAGRGADAVDPLKQAIQLDPTIGEAHYVLGLVLRDEHQLPAARSELEESVRRAPGNQAAREALAEVYALEGNAAKASDQLDALAAIDGSHPDRLVAVGLAQARAGHQDSAVLTLGKALERFPDAPRAYAALGHVWLTVAQKGDRVALKKALEALTQAANRSDATSETFTELGQALLLAGDTAAAERALRQAVARLPVPPVAYLQLAEITARDGRLQDARDALIKYATLVGDAQPLAPVATQIADLSVRLGEPALAVRWFERAMDDAGPTPALRARLADAAWKAGDVDRARAVVTAGLATNPDDRALQQIKRRLPPV